MDERPVRLTLPKFELLDALMAGPGAGCSAARSSG